MKKATATSPSVLIASLLMLMLPGFAQAEEAAANGANTAWILTSTALVLFMTLPGLALFYGGLVRSKNVLSVLMQCFSIAGVVSILWLVAGYSLAFGEGNAWIGDFSKVMMGGVGRDTLSGDIPESLFMLFQMTFAIITPALVIGAFVERMKFSAMLLFSALWLMLVYVPVTHWVWGGGWLGQMGLYDFAGGTVVHITAGVAALVCALVLGPRRGFPEVAMPPHNMTMSVMGAGMLWVGWFGFNGGSALAANGDAAMAMLVTHISAAAGAMLWMTMEWIKFGKPSALGAVTGMVAGLGTITPASGFVGPGGALVIGVLAGFVCFNATIHEACAEGRRFARRVPCAWCGRHAGDLDGRRVLGHRPGCVQRLRLRRWHQQHGWAALRPADRCRGHRRLYCGGHLYHSKAGWCPAGASRG